MRFLLGFALVSIPLWVGYAVGRLRSPDPWVTGIHYHAKLLRKARWASLTRRDGLANIYSEAADAVLAKLDPPKELE